MRWPLFGSTQEAGPSSQPASPLPKTEVEAAPTISQFEQRLREEERVQEAQFPTVEDVPKCMQLFDEFFMCYALFPQLRNMYRHGEPRDCSYKFDNFKYCMSNKGLDDEERRKRWVRRRAEWWAARRVGASSEDVWDVREKPLENFPPLYPDYDSETPA